MWKTDDREFLLFAFRICGDFGVTIAVPAVLAALLGHWLDVRWDTRPWAVVICLVIAFGLTALTFKRKAQRYARAYDELLKKHANPVKKP